MVVRSKIVSPVLLAIFVAACGSDDNGGSPDSGTDGSTHHGDDDSSTPHPDGGSSDGSDDDGGTLPDGAKPDAGPNGPTDFATSFEPTDPPLTYTSTAETDSSGKAKVSGVGGGGGGGISGSIMGKVVAVTASGDNPPNEVAANAADGDSSTKWLVFANTGYVQYKLASAVAVKRYAVTSANDSPERDPKNWTLRGSQDGNTWTDVDTKTGQTFAARFQTSTYDISNSTAYLYYRFDVTLNNGGTIVQVADVQLSDGSSTPPPAPAMSTTVGAGPTGGKNAKAGVGFTGLHSLHYAGNHTASGRGYSYNKIYDVDLAVTASSELSYLIFPETEGADLSNPSTYAAVDLAFSDGTYLSDLKAADQHYADASPQGQGASRSLYPNEWNAQLIRIGDVAAGKQIKRILVGYDNANGPIPAFGGWIDDVKIVGNPAHPAITHLSDYVRTTRGTNSSGGYSRGNNFPATALPHGFNFWTPVTDASSGSWLYTYHSANNANNLTTLQAFALSHEPSPWMGDRQSFQVMPSAAAGTPTADRGGRALPFKHENEIAKAHYYSVKFENGIQTEIAPTDHAAIFRFTFPGTDTSLIFDAPTNAGGLTFDAANKAISGYSDAFSGLSTGATRMFFYATFDKDISASGMLAGGGGSNVTGYARFNASDKTVTMRIATSLIGVDQAKANLAQEIAANDTLETVRDRAQKIWDDKLGIIQVEGGNDDQRTTLYSNMYRLFLYPNSAFENTGTTQSPVYQYASPVTGGGSPTATKTGAKITSGKIYVNNGFWDTYRGAWPALSLLTPGDAGALIDGFVQQYRDGGWIARWSSPGYADLMTGTSSDVAFADAYVKGVSGFDAPSAYDAAVKNATTMPTSNGVGRKGLDTSIFLGYTSTSLGAGLSWAMAGYLNDFGIAKMAAGLAAANASDPRHQEYAENAEYFLSRALNYTNLYDPATGFFRGKTAAGGFAVSAGSFDPRVWGGDYTETDGWNTAFDAPYDGGGLAALMGGPAALGTKLDTFFATPETAGFPGSYGGVIHEMLEAKDVRMGQLGLSNQPSFHIPYMYVFAGQPSKTQAKVRDALARMNVGSEIGQGYLGDEDNGASSAWQIFGALGFYPLQVGSPNYVIGSPLFTKATINLENGNKIVINAPKNSAQNIYVQSLKVNGKDTTALSIAHSALAAGATFDFEMGATPSNWGTGAGDAPPSISSGAPQPIRGITGTATVSDGSSATALFDRTSGSEATFTGANSSVVMHAGSGTPRVTFYTLTSASTAADPTGWVVSGSNDGTNFTPIDSRSGQSWKWRRQTRAFKIATPGAYAYYRIAFTGNAGTKIAEVELLAGQ